LRPRRTGEGFFVHGPLFDESGSCPISDRPLPFVLGYLF